MKRNYSVICRVAAAMQVAGIRWAGVVWFAGESADVRAATFRRWECYGRLVHSSSRPLPGHTCQYGGSSLFGFGILGGNQSVVLRGRWRLAALLQETRGTRSTCHGTRL